MFLIKGRQPLLFYAIMLSATVLAIYAWSLNFGLRWRIR